MNDWWKIALIAGIGLLLVTVGMFITPTPDEAPPAPEAPVTQALIPDASMPDASLPTGPARIIERSALSVVDHAQLETLRRIISADNERPANVFAKIGGSSTVSRAFLHCFPGPRVDLGSHTSLEETRAFFSEGRAARSNPFQRESLSAGVGWHSGYLLAGHPPRYLREVRRLRPRYALFFVGGNDVAGDDPFSFTRRFLRMVEGLIRDNTIPILGTLQPRRHRPSSDAVSAYNKAIRAVASAMHLPIIDYHEGMLPLPNLGLAGDGVHPNVRMRGPVGLGCDLSDEGLRFGTNTRNLMTLQMLDRLHQALDEEDDDSVLGETPIASHGDPAVQRHILEIPFAEFVATASPAFTHRFTFEVEESVHIYIRAVALCDGESGCPRRRTDPLVSIEGHEEVDPAAEVLMALDPGRWTLVVQQAARPSRSGRYLLQVDADPENGG